MPSCITGEAGGPPAPVRTQHLKALSPPRPGPRTQHGAPGNPRRPRLMTRLTCPSCGSPHVAQMLGDNGGISYVCTACGHIWS
jgi:hypothetical protein